MENLKFEAVAHIDRFEADFAGKFQALRPGTSVRLTSRIGDLPEGTVVVREMAPGGGGIVKLKGGGVRVIPLEEIGLAGFVEVK